MKCSQAAITGAIASVSLSLISLPVSAQVIPDTALLLIPDSTLGEESSVVERIDVTRQEITGGARRHSSLFHSFQEFNVPAQQEVYFVPDMPALNIFTRVTGNNVSNILGKLGVDGGSNLFLINPNGIYFGTDAKLDVSGSFMATTAERLEFADGTEFSAINPQDAPLLTIHSYDPIAHYGIEQATMFKDGKLVADGELSADGNLTLGAPQLEVNGNLYAGRDIVLQGENLSLSNGKYTVGSYLFTKDLWGNILDFVVPHENVIIADGDVEIIDHNHRSLYILAAGSVISKDVETIEIDRIGGNLEQINAELINGEIIEVNADGRKNLDIRAGVAWLTDDLINTDEYSPGLDVVFKEKTGSDIIFESPEIINHEGNITLISGARSFENGNIRLGIVNSSGTGRSGGDIEVEDGGNIYISNFSGDILINELNSYSRSDELSYSGDLLYVGDGGNAFVATAQGEISIGNVNTYSRSDSSRFDLRSLDDVKIGSAGDIFLLTDNGNITTGDLMAYTRSEDRNQQRANGGDIGLWAISGNITTGDIDSSISIEEFSEEGEQIGNGGDILISTTAGEVSTKNINSSILVGSDLPVSEEFNVEIGDSGNILISTTEKKVVLENINSSIFIQGSQVNNNNSYMTIGNAGTVNITTTNADILSKQINTSAHYDSNSTSRGSLQIGDGGAVSLHTTNGDISIDAVDTFTLSSSDSDLKSGNGGNIDISTTQGNIEVDDINSSSQTMGGRSSQYTNGVFKAGDGGSISLKTQEGHIFLEKINASSESSYVESLDAGDGGHLQLSTTNGDIKIGGSVDLSSRSVGSVQDNDGNAGNFTISLIEGDIIVNGDINSFSRTTGFYSRNGISTGSKGGNVVFEIEKQGSILTRDVNLFATSTPSQNTLSSRKGNSAGSIWFDVGMGNIQTGEIDLSSLSGNTTSARGIFSQGGNGGSVQFSILEGNIQVPTITTTSRLFTEGYSLGTIKAGSGGDIHLETRKGNIDAPFIETYTLTSNRGVGLDGNGGDIALITHEGDIHVDTFQTWSFINQVGSSSTARGGDITLFANKGRINSRDIVQLNSWVTSGDGTFSGEGGNINISTTESLSNYEVVTVSAGGKSGDVNIESSGDFTLDNFQIATSQIQSIPDPFSTPTKPRPPIIIEVGQNTQSGSFTMRSQGSLTVQKTVLESTSKSNNNAGNVTLQSNDLLTIHDDTQLISNTTSLGQAGNFDISSGEKILITGGNTRLLAKTSSQGYSGNFNLTAPVITIDQNATISTSTEAEGNAGIINVNANVLNVLNGGQILSDSDGSGNGGLITVNATESVNLGRGVFNSAPIISAKTTNSGKAGNIFLNTPQFNLSETASITATATATATNPEGGGSITISADQMNLAGVVGIFAETQGNAPAGRLLLKPYQNNPNLDIDLFPGSKISAATSGSGNGGDLIVTAPNNIDISGAGILSVETSSSGNAGTISVTSNNLALRDGVTLSASTAGSGNGGFIKFIVAGDINIFDSFVKAITTENSTGKGGSIDIDPINTNLVNSRVAVDSRGQGIGGDIFVTSEFLNLNNSAIATETFSSDGGNIFLDIGTQLFLRKGSNITATAGLAKKAGNGGNIIVLTPTIIASANEDNNIFADAFSGLGGRIFVSVNQLINIGFQTENIPVRNDITASSEILSSRLVLSPVLSSRLLSSPIFASRLVASPLLASLFNLFSGSVIIESEVDEDNELPAPLVDADSLIGKDACAVDNNKIAGGSTFVIQGQGGLPTMPEGNVNIRTPILSYLANPDNVQAIAPTTPASTTPKNNEFAIAQGWQRLPNGKLQLISFRNQTRQNLALHPSCLAQES